MPRRATARALTFALWAGLAGAGWAEPASSAPVDELEPAAQWAIESPDLHDVEVLGSRVWAVGYWGTVLWSEDGGERFERAATPVSETLFDVSFADARHGWAVGARGTLLHSRDGGRTWVRQSAAYADEFGDRVPVDSAIFGVSAVSATEAWAVGDLGYVLHSTDGESWQVRVLPEEVYGDGELADRILNAVDFTSPRRGYIAGEFGALLRTADGGESWESVNDLGGAPASLYLFSLAAGARGAAGEGGAIGALSGDRVAAAGLEGTALVSADGGSSWRVQLLETRNSLYGVAWSGARAIAVGDAGTVFVTPDGGATWDEARAPRVPGWLGGVAWGASERAYAVGAGGALLRSLDGGRTWERRPLPGDPQRSGSEARADDPAVAPGE